MREVVKAFYFERANVKVFREAAANAANSVVQLPPLAMLKAIHEREMMYTS